MSEESEFPTFITKEYCQNILDEFEGHEKTPKLVDFVIEHGSKKGDNFASCIYRAKLIYNIAGAENTKDASFIIKAKSKSSAISDYLDKYDTFQKETYVYKEILATCEQLDSTTKIAPK